MKKIKTYGVMLVLSIVLLYSKKDKVLANDSVEVIVQPKSVTGAVGNPMSMSVTASGTGLSYQWEYYDGNAGVWRDYIGGGVQTLESPIYDNWNGLRLRCRVTDANGNIAVSDEATVSIVNKENWELPIV